MTIKKDTRQTDSAETPTNQDESRDGTVVIMLWDIAQNFTFVRVPRSSISDEEDDQVEEAEVEEEEVVECPKERKKKKTKTIRKVRRNRRAPNNRRSFYADRSAKIARARARRAHLPLFYALLRRYARSPLEEDSEIVEEIVEYEPEQLEELEVHIVYEDKYEAICEIMPTIPEEEEEEAVPEKTDIAMSKRDGAAPAINAHPLILEDTQSDAPFDVDVNLAMFDLLLIDPYEGEEEEMEAILRGEDETSRWIASGEPERNQYHLVLDPATISLY